MKRSSVGDFLIISDVDTPVLWLMVFADAARLVKLALIPLPQNAQPLVTLCAPGRTSAVVCLSSTY